MIESAPSESTSAGGGSASSSSPPSSGSGPSAARVVTLAVLALIGAVFLVQSVQMSLHKSYSVDELTYAHGSWSIARGGVPFRDFFHHHTPLLLQLGALPLSLADDDPNNVLYLRLLMLPFLGLICAALFRLNREADGRWAMLAPVLALSTFTLATLGTEFRPDTVAFALFLAMLALLRGQDGPRPELRAFAAGLALAAAVWASEKVVIYGVFLAVAWLLDVTVHRRSGAPPLLLRPRYFVLGGVCGTLLVLLYLTLTKSWPAFIQWGIRWPFVHQKYYPGFSWLRFFVPFLERSGWLIPLAAVGVAATVRRIRSAPRTSLPRASAHPDVLLLALLVTGFLSYAMQKSAYPYSLIPFAAMLALFASRGVLTGFRWAAGLRQRGRLWATPALLGICLFLGGGLLLAYGRLELRGTGDNAYQHEVFHLIHELTAPEDPVYDNTGGYVSRPHVSFFYFTDATVRRILPKMLAEEMPAAILRSGCTAFLLDTRFGHLPDSLKTFVAQNFQAYNGDLYLWGRRYRPEPAQGGQRELRSRFLAVRDAAYFVDPPEALARGELRIGGQPVTESVFRLPAGELDVDYRGAAEELYILWLPRNGETYSPRPGLPPRFAHLF